MGERAADMLFKVEQLSREEKKWKVTEVINERIYTFESTIPLIQYLRDESMRDRHWKELRIEVKEDFEEGGPDFTLERVFSLNLLAHQDKIEEINQNAKAQLKIEKSLDTIEHMWERSAQTNLEIEVGYKKGSNEPCYKIARTEDIITTIEEHSGELAKHKSSPFYKQFDDKIDMWENNIAKITETLEILMLVQERWQHLESIFGGQAHIQKQLAQEYSIFRAVDQTFCQEMARIHKVKNAYRSLVEDARDFVNVLTDLNRELERVQKKLNDLLAAKRAQFPRFFFLSNEDLLEIIGQPKDPESINRHISKIYEGITKIECDTIQANKGQKENVINAVVASDGEKLAVQELSQSQPLELTTNVEAWMKNLTEAARISLMKEFYTFAQSPPSAGRKPLDKDKMTSLVAANLGQILLTYNQIEWTQNVKSALQQYSPETTQGNAHPLKKLRTLYKKKIETYIQVVEQRADKLPDRDRSKVEAMIIMEEHNREVVDKLFANK